MPPDPFYDGVSQIDMLAPGLIAQREVIDAEYLAYAANGYQPLTAAQIVAAVGPLPPLLTGIAWIPGEFD